jgi:hypothetical protein
LLFRVIREIPACPPRECSFLVLTGRNNNAMREVLAFLFSHWRREDQLLFWVALCMFVTTAADLLTKKSICRATP